MNLVKVLPAALVAGALILAAGCGGGSDQGQVDMRNDAFNGRWDVTVQGPNGAYPSWFEITGSDSLAGRFVGQFGSARPIQAIHVNGDSLYFSLPRQYENQRNDLEFTAVIANGSISGMTVIDDGAEVPFTAVRAPELPAGTPVWGEPVALIGTDLSNWKLRNPSGKNSWKIKDGVLINQPPGVDIMTTQTFNDFKLHIEFTLAEHSNSGIYLRGRHEIQLLDGPDQEPESHNCGGVYGFIDPSEIVVKPTGEWNVMDVTFVGRMVNVVLNGVTIIDNTEIPGITGGAINCNEAEPGPIMLQGDHGAVSFRNIVITPAI